jgi:hypothetical protein
VRRATLQELDLHFADTAADLEDGRPLDPLLLEKSQHALRRLVDAVLAITLGSSPRHARREEAVAATGITAARHTWAAYGAGRRALFNAAVLIA